MDLAFLEQLGLEVSVANGVVEALLPLRNGQALNPLTRRIIENVSFTSRGDQLIFVGPPELVGAAPINLAFLSPSTRLEDLVVQTLTDQLFQLERRSSELTSMGISPKVDPATLQLTAELERAPFRFIIAAARNGQFKVSRVTHQGAELTKVGTEPFELSEFFDRRALEDYLFALVADLVSAQPQAARVSSDSGTIEGTLVSEVSPDSPVTYRHLFAAFGDMELPARSTLEIVASLTVKGQRLRFAAARVQGRTFRGLLAGPEGKIWADRFELDTFPGIKALVSGILEVEQSEIEIVPT